MNTDLEKDLFPFEPLDLESLYEATHDFQFPLYEGREDDTILFHETFSDEGFFGETNKEFLGENVFSPENLAALKTSQKGLETR